MKGNLGSFPQLALDFDSIRLAVDQLDPLMGVDQADIVVALLAHGDAFEMIPIPGNMLKPIAIVHNFKIDRIVPAVNAEVDDSLAQLFLQTVNHSILDQGFDTQSGKQQIQYGLILNMDHVFDFVLKPFLLQIQIKLDEIQLLADRHLGQTIGINTGLEKLRKGRYHFVNAIIPG
ncbi:hypothetical protein D3C75_1050370 [compost metagenome]